MAHFQLETCVDQILGPFPDLHIVAWKTLAAYVSELHAAARERKLADIVQRTATLQDQRRHVTAELEHLIAEQAQVMMRHPV